VPQKKKYSAAFCFHPGQYFSQPLPVGADPKWPLAVVTRQCGIDKRVFALIPLGHLSAQHRVVDADREH